VASLSPMLEASSVAVVGASARPGSFGETLLGQLVAGGHRGSVWPVNPRYQQVAGLPCLPSLRDLPEAPDLVAIGLPNDRIEEALRDAAAVGARAAVVFASCYEEVRPGAPPLTERLARIAAEARMSICGGNCMGFLHPARSLLVCGFAMPKLPSGGEITFISHSGSAFSAFAYNNRMLRFNLVVSAGQEINTTAAHYLDFALAQPETKVVGMFLEAVRAPGAFRDALDKARDADIPVVALKVGKRARARALITAHSGALAGEDSAYEALFDAYGVVRVESLDEMADTLELFASKRRAPAGGLASIHDSGGERALFVDAAAAVGVPFTRISPATRARLAAVLEEGLLPENPLDAWGTGNDYEGVFERCMRALAEDPDTAGLAFSVDLTTQEVPETGYVAVAKTIHTSTGKPFAVVSNLGAAIDARDAASLRAAGIPVLASTLGGLSAFKHLFAYRDARARPAPSPPVPVPAEVSAHWRARLAAGEPMRELDALDLLRDYGVPVVRSLPAADAAEAVAAGDRLGWPVALKTAAPGVLHKTDAGGVILDVASPAEMVGAFDAMAARLGPATIVAEMAVPGVELALGVVRDEQFGPLVMAGAGGVLIEQLQDRRWALPPLDEVGAGRLLAALACRPLLDGIRGAPPADAGCVARALARLSELALDLGDFVDAIDVNPLVASPAGCVAVDAVVVGRRERAGNGALSADGRTR
jgi:acetate---CoA ligase (ADP-forming)